MHSFNLCLWKNNGADLITSVFLCKCNVYLLPRKSSWHFQWPGEKIHHFEIMESYISCTGLVYVLKNTPLLDLLNCSVIVKTKELLTWLFVCFFLFSFVFLAAQILCILLYYLYYILTCFLCSMYVILVDLPIFHFSILWIIKRYSILFIYRMSTSNISVYLREHWNTVIKVTAVYFVFGI